MCAEGSEYIDRVGSVCEECGLTKRETKGGCMAKRSDVVSFFEKCNSAVLAGFSRGEGKKF